jgi:TRAP-type mannitol/chloroaromatic compound transport system permease small subunit
MREIFSIHQLVKWVGEKSAWLNLILIFLICLDVIQRYLFNQTFNWVIELEWHFFGLIFLLGSAYTLQQDKHVRVDVFYSKFSESKKAAIDVFCHIFLLIPWCLVGVTTCYKYASNAFYIREGSPNPGGLPAIYIIKYAMVLCFVLILLQAISMMINQIKTLVK